MEIGIVSFVVFLLNISLVMFDLLYYMFNRANTAISQIDEYQKSITNPVTKSCISKVVYEIIYKIISVFLYALSFQFWF
jgi:hypothetical protein